MSVPPELNMHKINDYLISNGDLSHAELRVVLHTIHLDFGRKKQGLFWKSASAVAEDCHCDRETVARTWEKMVQKGWLEPVEGTIGRSTKWRILYKNLWNESQNLRDYPAGSGVVPAGSSSNTCGTIQQVPAGLSSRGADSSRTNLPKEAAELNLPKESPHKGRAFSEDRKTTTGGDGLVRRKKSHFLPDPDPSGKNQVQGKIRFCGRCQQPTPFCACP